MQLVRLVLWTVMLLGVCLPSHYAIGKDKELTGFDAEYSVHRFGRKLGFAKLSLSKEAEKYRLDYYSKVSAFFLSDIRSEISYFTLDGEQLMPYSYAYSRSGTGRNKSTKIDFDAEQSSIVINQGDPINWLGQLDNQLYRLDIQLRLASGKKHFSYDIINSRGQLRHYDLKVGDAEQLDLPFGLLEGIKVTIERTNSSRETIAWFSPQLNYQLVKLQQFKDGSEQGEIRLQRFTSKDIAATTSN